MRNDERPDYYASAFAPHMAEFICFKRALGLKYKCETLSLRAFSKFIDKHTSGEDGLTREIIDEWCRFRPNETRKNQSNRASDAREFLRYLSKKGVAVHLPREIRKLPSSFTPYIFSKDELSRFLTACDGISTIKMPSVMPTILPLLFRLLYGCGLRISEALSLRVADVDVDAGVITVLQAKFNKDRLVPLSDSLSGLFREYSSAFHQTSFPEMRYFAHKDGRAIRKGNVYVWYRKILWAAGISHGGRGSGPRLHDFRHTFSVYALKAMTDLGMDIYCALPLLSTYLGHGSVSATGKYVRLTQDMFPEIVSKVSAISAFVIPGGD